MFRLRVPVFCLALLAAGACSLQTACAAFVFHQPRLKHVRVDPHDVVGGSATTVTGTVTLDEPAPTGGEDITLATSDSSVVSIPASVTIAAGATSATFAVTTSQVDDDVYARISASLGCDTKHTHLKVRHFTVTDFSFNPSSIKGGTAFTGFQTTVGTISIDTAAGAAGVVVTLTSDNSGTSLTNTVTIPAGASSVNFSLVAGAVTTTTVVHITATIGHSHKTTKLTITP